MARGYTLKKRAEQQAETRRRIAEAAVALHGTVGPARTTLSMVAEKAGVQRNTLYNRLRAYESGADLRAGAAPDNGSAASTTPPAPRTPAT